MDVRDYESRTLPRAVVRTLRPPVEEEGRPGPGPDPVCTLAS